MQEALPLFTLSSSWQGSYLRDIATAVSGAAGTEWRGTEWRGIPRRHIPQARKMASKINVLN